MTTAEMVAAIENMRGILGSKVADAQIAKVQDAARASVYRDTAAELHATLADNPETLVPAEGSGSITVFGSRTFSLPSITLPDGRRVRWNVAVVIDSGKGE